MKNRINKSIAHCKNGNWKKGMNALSQTSIADIK
jgi:hypothetical protein